MKKSAVEEFFEKKLDFFCIIQKVNDRCIRVVKLFVKSCRRQFEMIKLKFREVLYKASIIYEHNMVVCGKGGGINVYIICIVTLFLAEYCGFGWVVGTFFWIFWFYFRNRLKMLYFQFLKVRLKICRGSSSAIAKKNRNIRKKFQLSAKSTISAKKTSLSIY